MLSVLTYAHFAQLVALFVPDRLLVSTGCVHVRLANNFAVRTASIRGPIATTAVVSRFMWAAEIPLTVHIACGTVCTGGAQCTNGVCACPPGSAKCGNSDICISITTDYHCGGELWKVLELCITANWAEACDNTCGSGKTCRSGQCVAFHRLEGGENRALLDAAWFAACS